ncbi:MAG TPA: hypothetical protein VMR50_07405 [Myxococcota bacterium]|nr:hypothetical protein [Myxococcota bacterium]
MSIRIALCALALEAACATNLVIKEQPINGADGKAATWNGGLPVNKRAAYQPRVQIARNVKLETAAQPGRLDGVDPRELLSVDISRQAFATGKLEIDLDESQRLKKVTISSTSGAADGLTSASEVIQAIAPAKSGGK